MLQQTRIYLSSPHLSGREQAFVADAFATNWIAPLGPHVDEFEREFAAVVGAPHAVALSSGTAALHLALVLANVRAQDEVMVSTFTFAASVNPIVYLGARPVLVDSERTSWNMDPELLADALHDRARRGALPRAVVVVHIYGQSANLDPIDELCQAYGIPLVEDAAEALGATYRERAPGTIGLCGAYSFNGNKIITTSGGGMLVTLDGGLAARARRLSTQARDPAPHYEHSEIGYNYRLSNVLAAIGRGQLPALADRVAARRRNFDRYAEALCDLPGIGVMPEAPWGRHTRWNSVITIDRGECGVGPEQVRLALAEQNIESRPVWKPMHRQPVFAGCECIGGGVADDLFARGLCLPSGSNLTPSDLERVIDVIRIAVGRPRRASAAAPAPIVSGAA
jgi:dTDP-4-amino-4,6-dideoxygalactose transaminase